MTHQENAVIVENLTKTFKIPTESSNGLKQKLINTLKGKKGYREFTPLNNVSFEIKKGEFFGIVGRNGSGKSTLLKSIANIYTPTRGSVHVDGSLVPFIELGVGFNPELTGRENVFLNGALLGFSRAEMEAMYDDIVDFAEIGDFMDEKLKNYSSGMQVRLAFSIAIRADGDILLLDEVLAVGDEAFQRKCFDYFAQLKIEKKTVILVTHGMSNVRDFCDRAMLLSDGQIKHIGSTQEITELYEKINLPDPEKELVTVGKKIDDSESIDERLDVAVKSVSKSGKDVNQFLADDKIYLEVNVVAQEYIDDVFLGISIHKPDGEAVFVKTTEDNPLPILNSGAKVRVLFEIQNIFAENTYYVNISIKSNDRAKVHLIKEDTKRFRVVNSGIHKTTFRPIVSITYKKDDSKDR